MTTSDRQKVCPDPHETFPSLWTQHEPLPTRFCAIVLPKGTGSGRRDAGGQWADQLAWPAALYSFHQPP